MLVCGSSALRMRLVCCALALASAAALRVPAARPRWGRAFDSARVFDSARPPAAHPPLPLPRVGPVAPGMLSMIVLALPTSASADLMEEFAKPPISLNPFSIQPAGYAFIGLYICYLGWSIFRPPSEAEIAYNEKVAAEAAEAAAAAPGFLAAAAAAEGARRTASGLVFQETAAAEGASPTMDDTVRVHYVGTLADGTVFDSSRERGEPTEFKVRVHVLYIFCPSASLVCTYMAAGTRLQGGPSHPGLAGRAAAHDRGQPGAAHSPARGGVRSPPSPRHLPTISPPSPRQLRPSVASVLGGVGLCGRRPLFQYRYGEMAMGKIPANSALQFEVAKLLSRLDSR